MSIVMAFAAMAFTSIASADVVPFQWSTSGAWGGSHSGLSFTGVGATSGSTNSAGSLDINLGSFTLNNPSSDYTGTFSLTLNFLRPDGTADPVFPATVKVDANYFFLADTATIDFSNSQTLFTFSGTDGTGSFSFSLDDVTLTTGWLGGSDTGTLTGHIRNAAITPSPEPSSIILLGSLAGAFALIARKKFFA